MTDSTDPVVATDGQLVWLDPAVLVAHPTNVRSDLGDLRSLAASIRSVGVLEPLVVCPVDGGHRILAGHRRAAAAVLAEHPQVPVYVRPDLTGEPDQVAAMLCENLQRLDLSTVDQARGFEQLAAFGLSDRVIAKRTGAKPAQVRKARAVAASETAAAVTARYGLTLDQAAALAEFDDDRDAVKQLAVVAAKEPHRFDHALARLREDRADQQARAAKAAELTEAGLTVIDPPSYPDPAVRLSQLVDDEGQDLDPEGHRSCPGYAVSIDPWYPDEVDHWCTDPAAHGHQPRYSSAAPSGGSGGSGSGGMTEEQKAERRLVIDNNKAWRAATDVRRAYLRQLLARRTAPKGTLRFAAAEILTDPDGLGRGPDDVLADLLGDTTEYAGYGRHVGPAALERVTDARLPLLLLAQVAARHEATMGVHTWRHRDDRAARWLAWLAGTGYTLAEIEQTVIDATGT